MNRDNAVFGFIIGLLLPLLGFFIMYLLWGSHQGVSEFARSLTRLPGMAAKVLTLSILVNLIPFVYCNVKRIDLTMRGIVIATTLYAVLVILIKFVW